MSEPEIPEVEQEQSLTDLLESIALEEVGLAHILNAEGEKIQALAQMMEAQELELEEAIEQQETIMRVLRMPIKQQMLLQFKLEDVLDFKEELEIPPEPPVEVQTNTATVTAIGNGVTVTDSQEAFYNIEIEENEEVNNS